ncbi:MAG: triacylglycerol lipase [Mycobacterium sp.]|nr:triacylglycerol lipase [Mycobacterium sp.]
MSQVQMEEWHQSPPIDDAPRRRDGVSPPGPFGGARTLVRTIGRAAMVQAYELGLMASVVTTASLHLVGGGTDPAFVALQRVPAHPASSTCPVLLVHGLGGTKSSWSFVARALAAKGLTVDAITYTPFGTSVEQLADRLVVKVERILSRTGADKVHLIGHSLGGVVIAQAIASGRLAGKVDTIVTLGAPFGGSPWAHLAPFGAIVRALRQGSPLLRRLASAPVPEGVRWLAITATLDMIVPGVRSVPAHAEVKTVAIGGVGHLGMLLSPEVVGSIVAAFPQITDEDNASDSCPFVNPVTCLRQAITPADESVTKSGRRNRRSDNGSNELVR